MTSTLKLMLLLAHPDDESFVTGGLVAKYAAEGIACHLVVATRGERGWLGERDNYPGREVLGMVREAELRAAAVVLGLQSVSFLDYPDGELDTIEPTEAIAKIVGHLRHVKPDVVVAFDPYGGYGHPDHIAISQFTTAAIVEAANPHALCASNLAAHSIAKFYYTAQTEEVFAANQSVFGSWRTMIDGVERSTVTWPAWSITTRIDTGKYVRSVARAIACHKTQVPISFEPEHLSQEQCANLWGTHSYYRVFSLVNGGRRVEDDLFAGLR